MPAPLYCAAMTDQPNDDSPNEAHGQVTTGTSTLLPDVPALVPARLGEPIGWGAMAVSRDGEIDELPAEAALDLLAHGSVLTVHGGFTARRIALGLEPRKVARAVAFSIGPQVLDLLELFAFVHPASPCLPTPNGLARALNLAIDHTPEAQALMLHEATHRLLTTLRSPHYPDRSAAGRIAYRMAEGGWAWGPAVKQPLATLSRATDGHPLVGASMSGTNYPNGKMTRRARHLAQCP